MPAEPNIGPVIAPSPRKLKSLAKLQSLPAKFSDGRDYNLLQHIIPGVTLEQVRQDLSSIRGSLVDTIRD